MAMFDPNAPMDFAGQTASLEQQRKQAELQRKMAAQLRSRADSMQGPEGQMVSGIYVKPSWAEYLPGLLNQYQAGSAERKAAETEKGMSEAEKALAQQAQQARSQWQSSLPQAQEQQTAPFMAPGIDGPENIPGTETITQQALPLTVNRVLKHTLAGMQIPGNEKEAAVYNTGALAEINREDTQKARQETLAQTLAAQRQTAKDNLEFKQQQLDQQIKYQEGLLEQKGLSVAETARNNRVLEGLRSQQLGIQSQLAGLQKQGLNVRQTEAAARLAAAKEKATEKATQALDKDVEKLSKRAEILAPTIQPAMQIQGLIDAATDPKTGKVPKNAKIPGFTFLERNMPLGMLNPEQAAGLQAQQSFGNALLRAQAGLSQTLSEAEKALVEQMRKGTATQDQFLAVWPALSEKLNASVNTVRAGYNPKVVEAFEARLPQGATPFRPVQSKYAKPTAATPKPPTAWKVEVEQ